jgi:hypothetical protein
MQEGRERERERGGGRDEVEEDWKIIRNWHAVGRDGKEWRTILLTTKINKG